MKLKKEGVVLNKHRSSFIRYVGFDDKTNCVMVCFKKGDLLHKYSLSEKQYLFVKEIFSQEEKYFDRLFSSFIKKLAKHQQGVLQVING